MHHPSKGLIPSLFTVQALLAMRRASWLRRKFAILKQLRDPQRVGTFPLL